MESNLDNPPCNQCPVCLEEHPVLRLLDCKHMLCDTCIEKMKDNRTEEHEGRHGEYYVQYETIRCPQDRKETKVSELKSKLFVQMKCEHCEIVRSFSEYWWCEDCCISSCRYYSINKDIYI